MTKWTSIVFLSLFFTGFSWAQQAPMASFSPVPLWPKDGVIPPEWDGHYVFLDPEAGQMVVAYPENLGQAATDGNSGSMHIERFDLNNQVRASFAISVVKGRDGFDYRYSVSNAPQARQPISHVRLPVPDYGQTDEVVAPKTWQGARSKSEIRAMQLATGQSSGYFLTWYNYDAEERDSGPAIEAGDKLEGFRVVSDLKPGFTTAYVEGGEYPALRGDMPKEVLRQAAPLLSVEGNSQNLLTIAPKWRSDTHDLTIVSDFHLGLSRLIRHGDLNESSPAIREVMRELNRYIEASQAVSVPLDDFVGPRLVFAEKPKPGLEADIINALKVALNN